MSLSKKTPEHPSVIIDHRYLKLLSEEGLSVEQKQPYEGREYTPTEPAPVAAPVEEVQDNVRPPGKRTLMRFERVLPRTKNDKEKE